MDRIARFTAEQARDIGSCAIHAMAKTTGLTWDQVWEVAQYYFTKTGLNSCHKSAILGELGFRMKATQKLCQDGKPWKPMTVTQAEKWLKAHMPDEKLICSINVDRSFHAISFSEGRFHNLQGAKRSRIALAYIIEKI